MTNRKSPVMVPKDLETPTVDKEGWGSKMWSRVKTFEEARMRKARLKRNISKKEITKQVLENNIFTCTVYNKLCLSLVGLKSCVRTHGKGNIINCSAYVTKHIFWMQCMPQILQIQQMPHKTFQESNRVEVIGMPWWFRSEVQSVWVSSEGLEV